MESLDGIWRLVESRAWDENGNPLGPAYGACPMGQIMFSSGRMLAALCNGDAEAPAAGRGYSSYGGFYTFDGTTLDTSVDVASDPTRIGGHQLRAVEMVGATRMILRPPARAYGGAQQRRELLWERVWQPSIEAPA